MAKNTSASSSGLEGADYARVSEGHHQAIAIRSQGPDWVRAFARWSLLVEFELWRWNSCLRVLQFGTDRAGPKIGRRGNYFKAWTLANGEFPRKGRPMSPAVSKRGRFSSSRFKDSRRNSTEDEKRDAVLLGCVCNPFPRFSRACRAQSGII